MQGNALALKCMFEFVTAVVGVILTRSCPPTLVLVQDSIPCNHMPAQFPAVTLTQGGAPPFTLTSACCYVLVPLLTCNALDVVPLPHPPQHAFLPHASSTADMHRTHQG